MPATVWTGRSIGVAPKASSRPKWTTFSGSSPARFPLFETWKASVGATGRYQGNKQSAYSSTTAIQPQYTLPAYATLDLRTSAYSGPYTVRFDIENVTDKDGITGAYTQRIALDPTAITSAFIIRPRTYRLSLNYDF